MTVTSMLRISTLMQQIPSTRLGWAAVREGFGTTAFAELATKKSPTCHVSYRSDAEPYPADAEWQNKEALRNPVILPVFKTDGRPLRATVCSTHTRFRQILVSGLGLVMAISYFARLSSAQDSSPFSFRVPV